MIRTQNVAALFIKQIKDTLKNMPVLVLFIVYPIIAIVMTNAMKDQGSVADTFSGIFGTMHCVFTPIVAVSSILSEEKEKNTLRVLILSNVRLREYFISIGGFILIADLLTGSLFLTSYDISPIVVVKFLASMGLGCLISIIAGICVGLYAKNTAAASGLAVPFGMVFAFMPMLSNFNKGIEQVSRFTYGQQISYLLSGKDLSTLGIAVLLINTLIFMLLSAYLYKKSLVTM